MSPRVGRGEPNCNLSAAVPLRREERWDEALGWGPDPTGLEADSRSLSFSPCTETTEDTE